MLYIDNSLYHVYNRGAHKQPIFFSEENYRHCIQLFEKYSKTYSVSVLCYCLMPNHYHLLVRQNPGASISNFLKTMFNAYSQAVNKKYGHSGTLFQGRAKGKHIDSEQYIMRLARYIHLNPVTSGLTKTPEEWEYSDYRLWMYAPKEGKVNTELRDLFYRNGEDYRQYIQAFIEEQEKVSLKEYLFDQE